MIDSKMERLRYADEYQGLSEFAKKVRTINFNFSDDQINGVYEVEDENMDYDDFYPDGEGELSNNSANNFRQEGEFSNNSENNFMQQEGEFSSNSNNQDRQSASDPASGAMFNEPTGEQMLEPRDNQEMASTASGKGSGEKKQSKPSSQEMKERRKM